MDFTFDNDHDNSYFDIECDIQDELLSELSGLSDKTNKAPYLEANQTPFADNIHRSNRNNKHNLIFI